MMRPVGRSATARSCSARSPAKTTACENPSVKPVDLWTMQEHRPQGPQAQNSRPERNENCVTYVVGLNCYLCRRLQTCQEGMCSESSEPLAGRLGAPAQRRHRV